MQSRVIRCALICCLMAARWAVQAIADVRIGQAEFGYYAPEIRELHLRLPVSVEPVGGDEIFVPTAIELNGRKAPYVYYYFNGASIDYQPHAGKASEGRIELFVPVHWRANERHEVALRYTLNGTAGQTTVTLDTPETGGAWADSTDNIAFRVREEAGLARVNEPVDIDLTVEQARFPDPEQRIRATVMTAPGRFTEIPCQVYGVQTVAQAHRDSTTRTTLNRFRVVLPLALEPRATALVHLWVCPPRETPVEPSIRLEGGALGGVVSNTAYQVALDAQSGQLLSWLDRRLAVDFQLKGEHVGPGSGEVIHRTPDLFRVNKPWSHVLFWKSPGHRTLAGPLMVETTRWGEMPGVPEAFAKVRYRFFAGRPEVRAESSLRLTADIEARALRTGSFIFGLDLFTHIAWPEGDGTLRRVAVPDALGNDMGAPPKARFPVSTPWVAVYHRDRQYGFALITAKYAYFSDGPGYANESRAQAYVSNYRDRFLYTVRAATQTYCANVRSYPTPLEAGTTVYEDVAYLPFAFAGEDDSQFDAVWALYREMNNPLVIEP
jgi:hypothetical protein